MLLTSLIIYLIRRRKKRREKLAKCQLGLV
jgi:hypothetical protein